MYSEKSLIRGVFGALTILTVSSLLCTATCPRKDAVIPLSIPKFSGKWSIVAATPMTGNSVSKCSTLTVIPTAKDKFMMNFTAISHRSNGPVSFIMDGKVAGVDVIGTWQLQGSKRLLGPFDHRVIAAEYDSYLVMVVCKNNNKDLRLQDFALILSRDKSLSPMYLKKMKQQVLPYVNNQHVFDVDHTHC